MTNRVEKNTKDKIALSTYIPNSLNLLIRSMVLFNESQPLLEEPQHLFVGELDAFFHRRVRQVPPVEVAMVAGAGGLDDGQLE